MPAGWWGDQRVIRLSLDLCCPTGLNKDASERAVAGASCTAGGFLVGGLGLVLAAGWGSGVPSGVWVPNILSPYATWAYSWISPPSRSRRKTRIFRLIDDMHRDGLS
jgi:hypothetical protein